MNRITAFMRAIARSLPQEAKRPTPIEQRVQELRRKMWTNDKIAEESRMDVSTLPIMC